MTLKLLTDSEETYCKRCLTGRDPEEHFCPDMNEKMLTWTLQTHQNEQNDYTYNRV